jgi:hypothetical protein
MVLWLRDGPVVNGVHEIEDGVATDELEAMRSHASKIASSHAYHQQNDLDR